MSKRWPNLPHWQLIEQTFRACDHTSWRAAAAEYLGVEKRQLRFLFDRPLPESDLDVLHAKLKARAADYRFFIEKVYLPRLTAAQDAVSDAQAERLHEIRCEAERENADREAEDFRNSAVFKYEQAFLADLLIEEAA